MLKKNLDFCSVIQNCFGLQEAEQVEISQLGQLTAPKARHRSWYKIWQWRSTAPPVESSVESQIPRYICVSGRVEPIDRSRLLRSGDSQSTGVIHKVVTKEVVTVRSGSRFW